jgi:hypothetical protein
MLPFLKHRQEAAASGPVKTLEIKDSEFDSVEAAAMDLIIAVHLKDVKGVTQALRAAFELLDSEPHHEGEHY